MIQLCAGPHNPIDPLSNQEKSVGQSIGASAAWNYGNSLFVIVLGLLLTPYQLGKLGVEAYGVIMLETSFLSLATLINTSLVKAMVIVGGRNEATTWSGGDRVARQAGFAVCAAGALAAWLLLPWLKIPAKLLDDAQWLMVIFGIGQALNIIVATSQARLMLGRRFDLLNKALITGQVIQCAGIVLLFELFQPSLLLHGGAVLAGAVASRFLIWRYTAGHLAALLPENRGKPFTLGEFLRIWSQLAGMQISAVFSSQGLQLAANWFGGSTANAVIGLLMVMRGAVGRLNDGVANAVFSALATVYPHNAAKSRSLWLSATRGVSLISLPFVLAFALVPDAVAFLWLGRNSDVVARWLPLVALDICLPSLALITVQVLQLGPSRKLLIAVDVALMTVILANVAWLGLLGHASAGWLFLAYAGWRSIYGLVLLFGPGPRAAFSRWPDVIREVIMPVAICGIPAAAVIGLVRMIFMTWDSYTVLLMSAVMASVVYLPLVWNFGLDREMRSRLHERFGRGGAHAR